VGINEPHAKDRGQPSRTTARHAHCACGVWLALCYRAGVCGGLAVQTILNGGCDNVQNEMALDK
jgi:hypothetical protein